MQVITFESCVFQNCSQRYYEDITHFGVVTVLNNANIVNVNNCIFANNVYNGVRVRDIALGVSPLLDRHRHSVLSHESLLFVDG